MSRYSKLIKYPLSILVLGFIVLVNVPAFAAEGYFEDYFRQLYRQPTVCIVEPNDIDLPDHMWKLWHDETKKGIDEWENRIKSTPGSRNWDIETVEVSKDKLQYFNPKGCDIQIKFLDSTHFGPEAGSFNGWYTPSTKSIEIIRNQMTYCGKYLWEPYGIFLDAYCRGDELERGKKMAATVKHEFGHAFGLGHYVSDNRELMREWYDHPLGAPSIMAAAPPNEDVRQITQKDIEKVLEIHGANGFGKDKNPNPVFVYPEIIVTEPEISNTQNVQLIPYQTATIKITGHVPERLYSRGTPVEFEVTSPDGSKASFATMVNNKQYFEYPMAFNSDSMVGKYEILVMFKGEYIQKNAVIVSKQATSSPQPTIPSIMSSSGTYLDKISITSNNNDYHVKAHLGESAPPTQSVRIIAKNECPIANQVFQKDFMFKTGTEISFSFYQTSQGKPDKCVINFLLSDFNGNDLESISTEYPIYKDTKNPVTVSEKKIPSWIKNNVQWWSENKIDDDSFIQGMQFLIKEKIMDVTATPTKTIPSNNDIPSWVRNNAKWWVSDQISERDFISGIEFLVQNKIINVDNTTITGNNAQINTNTDDAINKNIINVSGTKYQIEYTITGGKLLSVMAYPDANSLIAHIQSDSEGSLTMTIPRSLMDAKMGDGSDDSFFVLVDLEMSKYDSVDNALDRTITISFPSNSNEIEIIGTHVSIN